MRTRTPTIYPEQSPPPTAHRLAAWLSLAKAFAGVPMKAIRFPASPDDVQALRQAWQGRVLHLRENGLRDLTKNLTFEKAMQCQAHAFAYAGEGRPCRLSYCPFCSAQEAACIYDRVRRLVNRHPGTGLILGTRKLRIGLGELSKPFELMRDFDKPSTDEYVKNLIISGGELGTIVRFSYVPHPTSDHRAILVARVLAAVPVDVSRRLSEARGNNGCASDGTLVEGFWDAIAVSPRSVPMAHAVAYLCEYPKHIFTSPSATVCKMLNESVGVRFSMIRGAFRSPLPDNPRCFTSDYVKTRTGFGVATHDLGGYFEVSEAIAAREFTRTFSLKVCDSFAEASKQIGISIHWVGSLPEFNIRVTIGRPKKCPLIKFLKRSPFLKGNGPFSHRVLACTDSSLGVCFIVTSANGNVSLELFPKVIFQNGIGVIQLVAKSQPFCMFPMNNMPGWQMLLPREQATASPLQESGAGT